MRTTSGLIFTPWVSSLKNVSRPALEAGIGALFFLLLIRFYEAPLPFLSVAPLMAYSALSFLAAPPPTFLNAL